MEKILGLDLGTNSIGWAIRDSSLAQDQIIKFGVTTFKKGVGRNKTGEFSFAAERTKKRATRRLYQARKYRIWNTLEVLITQGYCPLSIENLDKWRKYDQEEARKNNNGGRLYPVWDVAFEDWVKLKFGSDLKPRFTSPYALRRFLIENQLDFNQEENRFMLGRAMYHLAQRRGFKSSRKDKTDTDSSKEGLGENELADLKYSEKKKNRKLEPFWDKYPHAKTVGALFAYLEDEGLRIRQEINQYVIRQDLKTEIQKIFTFQQLGLDHSLYIGLVRGEKDKGGKERKKDYGSIFFVRPLRSQKGLVGKCTLEPNRARCQVSHPDFEEFRAWSLINNIKVKKAADPIQSFTQLSLENRSQLYKDLFLGRKKDHFPFFDIINYFKNKGQIWDFNYTGKTNVSGCPVSCRLYEIYGENWKTIIIQAPFTKPNRKGEEKPVTYTYEDLWHVLATYQDDEYVEHFATDVLGLDEKGVKQFKIAWNTIPEGYGQLSLYAIKKINRFLQKGLIYTEAVLLAKLPDIIGEEEFAANEAEIVGVISRVIEENRLQKRLLSTANGLISQYKNMVAEEKFGYKNKDYVLDTDDLKTVEKALIDQFGETTWGNLPEETRKIYFDTVKSCYQAFWQTGFEMVEHYGEKHFKVKIGGQNFLRADTGFYRLPKLSDTLAEFLSNHFEVNVSALAAIYHPSQMDIYPRGKANEAGMLLLGSPKSGSFKNPMAMRTLHVMRGLINHLILVGDIDEDTRIVVEVARELNDANKRWAIESWQRTREAENQEFAKAIEDILINESGVIADSKSISDIDKFRIWYEQSDEDAYPDFVEEKKDVKGIKWASTEKETIKKIRAEKDRVLRYRLWQEQSCRCIYTGNPIRISDLFQPNLIDFEHTIPRSISFDNSLANLTVCYADYNRNIKKKQIPFQLTKHYEGILDRIRPWEERVAVIKQQIEFWKGKAKKAATKGDKDDAIRQRHLWQMDLNYWENKVNRFKMEEVTTGFRNSQLVDTQIISKYAFHYLKTAFNRVDVQKGSITADFRKIYKLQPQDEIKDRSYHSHHAKDAAVLTLIPVAVRRDAILEKAYKWEEEKWTQYHEPPYASFKTTEVLKIDDEVFVNQVSKDQTLTRAKKKLRQRGKLKYFEDPITKEKKIRVAQGDIIRGQIHGDTFYGKIKRVKFDEDGKPIRDEEGKFILDDKNGGFVFVKRETITKDFKTDRIVDPILKLDIDKQVSAEGSMLKAIEAGLFRLNSKGEKIKVDKNGRPLRPVRHVRIIADVTDPLVIKDQTHKTGKEETEYKNHYYATNTGNYAYGIFENETERDFVVNNLFDSTQMLKGRKGEGLKVEELFEKEKETGKGKKKLLVPLTRVIIPGMRVIFFKENKDELKEISKSEMRKRLYVVNRIFDRKQGLIQFQHHMEARDDAALSLAYPKSTYGEKGKNGFSEFNFEIPNPRLLLSKSKLNFALEGSDFEILPHGEINWLY